MSVLVNSFAYRAASIRFPHKLPPSTPLAWLRAWLPGPHSALRSWCSVGHIQAFKRSLASIGSASSRINESRQRRAACSVADMYSVYSCTGPCMAWRQLVGFNQPAGLGSSQSSQMGFTNSRDATALWGSWKMHRYFNCKCSFFASVSTW